MPVKVLDADFYFIAPLYINDWNAFEKEFKNTSKWTSRLGKGKGSLKNFLSCFLGEKEPQEFPMQAGSAYNGLFQGSDNAALKSLNNGRLKFKSAKDKPLDAGDDILFTIESDAIVLNVAPNHKCATVYINLKCRSEITLGQAVSLNYQLHKSDRQQSPKIYMKGQDGEWVCSPGRATLVEIINGMLPENAFEYAYRDRFISSTLLRLDTSDNPDEAEISDSLVRLGLAEDHKYKTSAEASSKVKRLFDNIMTYASNEALATVVLSPDPDNEREIITDFNKKAFNKSYLPLYLAAILADNCLKSALRHLDTIADDPDEQDRLREARMIYSFEPAQHTHLNKLMESIRADRQFELKYEAVTQSVEARRIRNEKERLELEKSEREAEEKALKLEKERIDREEKLQAKRDRFMNILLGFIGIGQVVFAVLQLAGANFILGQSTGMNTGVRYTSLILSAVFFGLIIWLLIYIFKKPKND